MKRRNKHAWLFAFTDLSFLLLISLSMVPSAPAGIALHFAEMDPPLVPGSTSFEPVETRSEQWELQVLEAADRPSPFRLVRVDSRAGEELEEIIVDRQGLVSALEELRGGNARPVLLAEKNSLSHDFLFAAAAMARVWEDGRRPTIVRPAPVGGDQ